MNNKHLFKSPATDTLKILLNAEIGWAKNLIRSGNIMPAKVGLSQVRLLLVRKIFFIKGNFFNFYSVGSEILNWYRVNKIPGGPLIYCESEVCSVGSRSISSSM